MDTTGFPEHPLSELILFMFHFNLLYLYGVAQLGLNDVVVMSFIRPRPVYILQEGTQWCVLTENTVQILSIVWGKKVLAQFQI